METSGIGNQVLGTAVESIDLSWPTASVAIVLLVSLLVLFLAAMRKEEGGIDSVLKLWAGLGTFFSAILFGLLGISVGEAKSEGQVEQARGAASALEIKVEALDERLVVAKRERERVEDDLLTAELAVMSAHLPTGARPKRLPDRYNFKVLDVGKMEGPILLDGKPDKDWIKAVSAVDWKKVASGRVSRDG